MPNTKQIQDLTPADIAGICDHTFLLRSEALLEEAKQTKQSAVKMRQKAFEEFLESTANLPYQPYAVCVRPEDVKTTRRDLDSHSPSIKIASVVGFPDGSQYPTDLKVAETESALYHGANEIDMVLNYNALKRGDLETVRTDIEMVERATHKHSALLKLILETSELTSGQIIQACTIANECKTGPVDFVKTSTGFGAYGARAEDLRLIRRHFNGGVKISGGVNSNNVYELLRAAADYRGGGIDLNPRFIRIGESSLLDQLSQNA